jgi:hypothetical protein
MLRESGGGELPEPNVKNRNFRTNMSSREEQGTFVKTATQYNLFWKNCTELLHQLFPGDFDCYVNLPLLGKTGVALPVSCQWLKGKNTEKELESAKTIVAAAWKEGREKSKKLQPLVCNLKKWAEDAARSRKESQEEYGGLCVVVAVVKRFSWLFRGFSPIQHLTIFFYHEKRPDRVCSLGINLGGFKAMVSGLFSSKSTDPNAGMRISSPDRLLIDMYKPRELDIVAAFSLSQKQAHFLAFALDHLESHQTFHNKSEEDAESDWQRHISKAPLKREEAKCKPLSKTACESTSHCRWFALTRGARKRCHPREN